MLTLNYDKQYDILYMGVADNSNSYDSEEVNNMNVFRDVDSDCITGFVIQRFMGKFINQELPIITEPFSVDYEKDVIPLIS